MEKVINFLKLKLYRFLYLVDFLYFSFWIIKKSSGRVFFVDLDNTLANTWPERLNLETFSWQYLPVHQEVLNFVKNYAKENNLQIIVLSARPYSAKKSTRYWLSEIAEMKNTSFFLTPDAKSKFKFIWLAKRIGRLGAIIDDCSHSHEFGTVLFYDSLIDKIRALKIDFFDYQFISKLQNP